MNEAPVAIAIDKDELKPKKPAPAETKDLKSTKQGLKSLESGELDESGKFKKQKKPKIPRIGFCKLFQHSSCCQKFLVYLGCISSCIAGASAPSIAIVFGEIVVIFDPNNSPEEINDGIVTLFKFIGALCGVQWIFGYLQYACLQAVAERVSFTLRTKYLRQLLQ